MASRRKYEHERIYLLSLFLVVNFFIRVVLWCRRLGSRRGMEPEKGPGFISSQISNYFPFLTFPTHELFAGFPRPCSVLGARMIFERFFLRPRFLSRFFFPVPGKSGKNLDPGGKLGGNSLFPPFPAGNSRPVRFSQFYRNDVFCEELRSTPLFVANRFRSLNVSNLLLTYRWASSGNSRCPKL